MWHAIAQCIYLVGLVVANLTIIQRFIHSFILITTNAYAYAYDHHHNNIVFSLSLSLHPSLHFDSFSIWVCSFIFNVFCIFIFHFSPFSAFTLLFLALFHFFPILCREHRFRGTRSLISYYHCK